MAHLGGGQRAGRLGSGQQPDPVGVLHRRDPPALVGVDRAHRVQRIGIAGQEVRLRFEQGRLLVLFRRRCVVGHR
jgi:hypothetical protein